MTIKNIRMDQLIRAIAVALDMVEGELLGASTNHGKRIAVLAAAMGRRFGMDDRSLSALTTCALFHDSALTEYILAEREGHDPAMKTHCQSGQRNVDDLLGDTGAAGFVLYHHERADGLGPFGKKEGDFPRGAALIAIADMLDVTRHLQRIPETGLPDLRREIAEEAGNAFTREASRAMLDILDGGTLLSLRDDRIAETARGTIPPWVTDIEDRAVFRIAGLSARIIDYKSVFTRRHSVQIANRSWLMGSYYGYGQPRRMGIYLAASLHDIGKIATPAHILEKPGRLSDDEFAVIKDHVWHTWNILKDVNGFEAICDLASSHHEKLDGTGYPFGKKAEALDFDARMLACVDIYQAVSEARPYHDRRSHGETMPVLYDMAKKGFIDGVIVKDMDTVMAEYSNRDVPPPLDAGG
ncbi:MAG: HD domain-containing protein [Spirochaetaceae bacterium]|jgi:HD-GYP domain-containing protein (c-di-GMP phosphodiesterase class II)|nr:HD domain-containing protein [Spirochaetaceae bacterium]